MKKLLRTLPDEFTELHEVCTTIEQNMIFSTCNNFTGKRVAGYHNSKAILTKKAAIALKNVQLDLDKIGYKLKIYDAYRPKKAVDSFLQWKNSPDNIKLKSLYYPTMDKEDLFMKGFIAPKSSHSRGSTIDITIVDTRTKREVDMGSMLGCFSKEAYTKYDNLPKEVKKNRRLLLDSMEKHGFTNLEIEWWHFTLKNEPFPDTYFDFDII